MNPHHMFSNYGWFHADPPRELKAGEDKYSHKRRKPHNSKNHEKLCKACRVRQVRGKCRNPDCRG